MGWQSSFCVWAGRECGRRGEARMVLHVCIFWMIFGYIYIYIQCIYTFKIYTWTSYDKINTCFPNDVQPSVFLGIVWQWSSSVKTCAQHQLRKAAEEHPILSSKVWQLQPDAALGGFWAPFAQRVRTGLQEAVCSDWSLWFIDEVGNLICFSNVPATQKEDPLGLWIITCCIPNITAPEVPLIPCLSGANGALAHWPLRQCRRPDSALLLELQLGPSDLERIGLAIPTDEFLRWVVGWNWCGLVPPMPFPQAIASREWVQLAWLWCQGFDRPNGPAVSLGGSSAYKAYTQMVHFEYINTWSILPSCT